jgi:hypothetical protein
VNTLADLIRAAQREQAEQAAGPDRIRAALPAAAARYRRLRRRRYAAVAGAVAVLVLASAVAVSRAVTRSPTTERPGADLVVPPAALRYRPGWLPSGWAEVFRVIPTAEDGSGIQRQWARGGRGQDYQRPSITLDVFPAGRAVGEHGSQSEPVPARGGAWAGQSGWEPVDINGRTGFLHAPHQGQSRVEWLTEDGMVVSLSQRVGNETPAMPVSPDEFLRIARSVVPDPGRYEVPLRLDWLPVEMTLYRASVSGWLPQRWRIDVAGWEGGWPVPSGPVRRPRSVHAAVVYVPPDERTGARPGRERIEIGGRPAWVSANGGGSGLVVTVELAPDWELRVTGGRLTRADMIRIAANAVVDLAPLAWVGAGPG